MRRMIATALAAFVLLGCDSAVPGSPEGPAKGWTPLPVDAAATQSVERLRSLPYRTANVEVVVGVLRAAGVGVYPDGASGGGEPVRLTRWQVANLSTEAANGGGVPGATLSAVAGRVDGAPPVSYLLAAWVAAYPSPAAGFARALLGPQDWRQAERIVFPRLLLTLFTADALRAGPGGFVPAARPAAAAPAGVVVHPVAYSVARQGPCSAVSTFVQNAIASVADALKVDTSGGGVLGFLGSLWNVAVDLAAGLVQGLVKTFGKAVLAPLVEAFTVLGVVQQVTSYLVEWRLHVRPEPEQTRFGVDDEVVTGRVEVSVTDNQLPVPDVVRDCAATFGVDLSRIGSAEGSTIEWETYSPPSMPTLATKTRADSVLDRQRTATLTYRTGQEPAARASQGQAVTGDFKVTAVLRREDVKKGQQMLQRLVLDNLPADIGPVVQNKANDILGPATDRFRELMYDKRASRLITVTFHDEPTTGRKSTPAPPTSCSAGTVTPGRYQGRDTMDYRIGDISIHLTWRLDVRVDDGGRVQGTLVADGRASTGPMKISYTVTGAVSKPVLSLKQGNGESVAFPAMTGGCDHLLWDFDWKELAGGATPVSGDMRLTVKARPTR